MVLGRVGIALSLAACAIGGSGCSILFAKGPPERVEPHEPIGCTRSYALPVVDGIITALQVARTLYAFSLSDQFYKDNPTLKITRSEDIGIGIALTGLFAISTGIGVSRVSGCNELLEKIERRPEPRRVRPANPFAPPAAAPDTDADVERAGGAAADEAKAAGEAAGAAQRKPQP